MCFNSLIKATTQEVTMRKLHPPPAPLLCPSGAVFKSPVTKGTVSCAVTEVGNRALNSSKPIKGAFITTTQSHYNVSNCMQLVAHSPARAGTESFWKAAGCM